MSDTFKYPGIREKLGGKVIKGKAAEKPKEPQNFLSKFIRIFFRKKNGVLNAYIEVIGRNNLVAFRKLSLRKSMEITKTLSDFIVYFTRTVVLKRAQLNLEDMKTLEKMCDILEIASEYIEKSHEILYGGEEVEYF